jgi:hypothetical protein
MARFISISLCLTLFTLPAATAFAQTCVGAASFASGSARIGAGIDFAEDGKLYTGQIAVGKAGGPFAAGSIGLGDIDDVEENATAYALELGYGVSMSTTRPFELCPVIGIGFVNWDDSEGGVSVELSSRQLSAGFSIGGVVSSTPTFAFVPAVSLIYTNEKLESEGVFEFEESEDYGVIGLAAGFIFNQRITVRPNIAFPVGLDDSDPTFGIGLGINFGTPSTSQRRAR